MSIPIKYIILEGPDCCGKTSLYSAVHRESGFKYNIHDRSFLSMLCYARLYGRDDSEHRRQLIEELCDANNFYVVLALPLDVILRRYRTRGDEHQNEESLKKLHAIFEEEIGLISRLPNVFVVRKEMSLDELSRHVTSVVSLYENMLPAVLGSVSSEWTQLNPGAEVQFRATLDIPVTHEDNAILNNPKEGDYYLGILRTCENVIQAEVSGRNEYNKPQGLDSRRFYYSSETCIASIHFLLRRGTLKTVCTLRSTDSERNGTLDLRFLSHLAASIPRTFAWPVEKILLEVRFNSLHVRHDLV